MGKIITMEIPEQLDWDQTIQIREILQLGLYQFQVRQALRIYQAGSGSLGHAAEQTGVSKRDLIREARARGIEPLFDEQTVREELGE